MSSPNTSVTRHRVILLRHGETSWSPTGRHTGSTDLELTAGGSAQALNAAGWLHANVALLGTMGTVSTSPLTRACRTAGALEPLTGREARRVDGLREFNYGDYEGLTAAEVLKRDPGWSIWRNGCPGGESFDGFVDRISKVIAAEGFTTGQHVIVAHSHVLRVLAMLYLDVEPHLARHFQMSPGSVSILERDERHGRVALWNFTPPGPS